MYSAPPFRLKRFPLMAAFCIIVVRSWFSCASVRVRGWSRPDKTKCPHCAGLESVTSRFNSKPLFMLLYTQGACIMCACSINKTKRLSINKTKRVATPPRALPHQCFLPPAPRYMSRYLTSTLPHFLSPSFFSPIFILKQTGSRYASESWVLCARCTCTWRCHPASTSDLGLYLFRPLWMVSPPPPPALSHL